MAPPSCCRCLASPLAPSLSVRTLVNRCRWARQKRAGLGYEKSGAGGIWFVFMGQILERPRKRAKILVRSTFIFVQRRATHWMTNTITRLSTRNDGRNNQSADFFHSCIIWKEEWRRRHEWIKRMRSNGKEWRSIKKQV